MPPPYFRRIVERSRARGVSRSEAIRQFIDDAAKCDAGTRGQGDAETTRLADPLAGREKQVMRDIAGQIRVAAVKLGGRLRLIDQPADLAQEIEKLAERLLVSL